MSICEIFLNYYAEYVEKFNMIDIIESIDFKKEFCAKKKIDNILEKSSPINLAVSRTL